MQALMPTAARRRVAPRADVPTSRKGRKNYLGMVILEARPVVQLIFVLRFTVGVVLAGHHARSLWWIIAGSASWWLAVVAVYAFNGVTDYGEDVANESGRPIARGNLPRPVALVCCAGATALAVILASRVPGLEVWLGIYLVLGWWYSAPPFAAKQRSSTAAIVVFGLGWSSYAAGTVSAGGGENPGIMVFGLSAAAWMALVGTLIKDISDVEGDAASGRRTFAVRYGPRAARHCATAGSVAVGIGSLTAAVACAPTVALGAVPFLFGAICLVVLDTRDHGVGARDRFTLRGGYRVFMRSQYLANLAILATHI